MPSPSLPARPNLGQLKKQAKDLLRAYRAAHPRALLRFRQSLPRLAGASDDHISLLSLSLRDAHLVVAREYGFDNWGAMKAHILERNYLSMIEMRLEKVRARPTSQIKLIVLKSKRSNSYLPIWIGPVEAEAIALRLQEQELPRPLTHDLMDSLIGDLGARVESVVITDIKEDTFFAKVILKNNGTTIERDSRPSDAIALAVRSNAPIFAEQGVFERVGVEFDTKTGLPEHITFDWSNLSIEDLVAMLSEEAQNILQQADGQAKRLGHGAIEPGDVMLALISQTECAGAKVLEDLGADLQSIKSKLENFSMMRLQASEAPLQLSESSQQILRLARAEAAKFFDIVVETEHLLLGFLLHDEGQISQVLREYGIEIGRARGAVAEAVSQWEISPLASP